LGRSGGCFQQPVESRHHELQRNERADCGAAKLAAPRVKMREAQAGIEPEELRNYAFTALAGSVHLSDLFGDKNDLFVIHNMGTSCTHCTLWADDFNGIYDHIADRASFAVASPDPPDIQKQFAGSRGWKFPMVSHAGTTFARDMGYCSENGGFLPDVSVFKRDGARILRVPISASGPATISARSGTCWISCRRVPMAGGRNSSTSDTNSPGTADTARTRAAPDIGAARTR
jgi:predicted dithiol-disulfide oxidoreductase (DUF899 family)